MKASSDRTIVTMMPSSTPNTITPRNAASERPASILSMRQSARSPRRSIRPTAAPMTTAASTADGRNSVRPGASRMNARMSAAPTTPVSCVREPACSATGVRDDDAETGNPPRSPPAMLARPMPAISWLPSTLSPRRAANVRESTALSAKATSAIPAAGRARAPTSRPLQPLERRRGKTLRERADDGKRIGQPEDPGEDHRQDDDDQHARHGGLHPLEHEDDDERAHAERHSERLHLAGRDRPGDLDDLLPHALGVDREAEQLRDLRDDHDQRDGVEVADPDRLGQQVGDEPEAEDAAEQQHPAHHDREETGERDRALAVAEGERKDRRRDDRGEGRVRSEHEDARRAEDRVGDERHDRGVEAGLGRQPGDLGVAHARGDEQRRHDDAGPDVGPQPRPAVLLGRTQAGQPAADPLRRHLNLRSTSWRMRGRRSVRRTRCGTVDPVTRRGTVSAGRCCRRRSRRCRRGAP